MNSKTGLQKIDDIQSWERFGTMTALKYCMKLLFHTRNFKLKAFDIEDVTRLAYQQLEIALSDNGIKLTKVPIIFYEAYRRRINGVTFELESESDSVVTYNNKHCGIGVEVKLDYYPDDMAYLRLSLIDLSLSSTGGDVKDKVLLRSEIRLIFKDSVLKNLKSAVNDFCHTVTYGY